jgi:anti-anti-sigma factor
MWPALFVRFGKVQDHPTRVLSPLHRQEGKNMALRMTNREVNGASVVALDGRVVLGAEGDVLREELQTLVREGKKKIVLKMNNIEYMDSAWLGTLIAAHLNAKSQGVSLKLCHLGSIRKSCKSAGWPQYFRCATPKQSPSPVFQRKRVRLACRYAQLRSLASRLNGLWNQSLTDYFCGSLQSGSSSPLAAVF